MVGGGISATRGGDATTDDSGTSCFSSEAGSFWVSSGCPLGTDRTDSGDGVSIGASRFDLGWRVLAWDTWCEMPPVADKPYQGAESAWVGDKWPASRVTEAAESSAAVVGTSAALTTLLA